MLAWVAQSVFQTMSDLAKLYQPRETGGCLLGYWVKPLGEVVVSDIVGPGPKAYHSRNRFVPDNEWQTAEIGGIYVNSGYLVSYLGDWHSHPGYASASLSWRDRITLRRIATHPPARAPHPIMGIIAKDDESWFWRIWCYSLRDCGIFSVGTKREFSKIRIYHE